MRLRRCALGALAGILLTTLPVGVAAQTTSRVEELQSGSGEVEPHADGFRHRSSGYVFPRSLGAVPARKSTAYGPGDADVQYTLFGGANGDGWINLYVYPADISLSEEVGNVTQSLLKSSNGQRVDSPPGIAKASVGVEEGWFEGAYGDIPVKTGYRVSRAGNWFIKARISIPTSADQATFDRIGAALNAIDFAPAALVPASAADSKVPVS